MFIKVNKNFKHTFFCCLYVCMFDIYLIINNFSQILLKMLGEVCKIQPKGQFVHIQIKDMQNDADLVDLCSFDDQPLIENQSEILESQNHKRETFMTKSEVRSFVKLYKENMSKWSMYGFRLQGKKQRYLKNFFRNSLRNFSSKLNLVERKKKNFQRNLIDPASLHLLLDILVSISKVMPELPQSYKEASIFNTHQILLHHCFEAQESDEEVLLDICRRVRKLKRLLKNLPNLRKHLSEEGYIPKLAQKIYNFEMNIVDNVERKKQNRFVKEIKMLEMKKNQFPIIPATQFPQIRSFRKVQRQERQKSYLKQPKQISVPDVPEDTEQNQKQFQTKKSLWGSTSYDSNPRIEDAIPSPTSKLFPHINQNQSVSEDYYERALLAHIQAYNMMMFDPHYQEYMNYRMAMNNFQFGCNSCRCKCWQEQKK